MSMRLGMDECEECKSVEDEVTSDGTGEEMPLSTDYTSLPSSLSSSPKWCWLLCMLTRVGIDE